MAESLADIDGIFFGDSETPITNALICKVMTAHPGVSARAQADYYEAVHQELAPLARDFERQVAALRSSRKEDIKRAARMAIQSAGKYTGSHDGSASALWRDTDCIIASVLSQMEKNK